MEREKERVFVCVERNGITDATREKGEGRARRHRRERKSGKETIGTMRFKVMVQNAFFIAPS